MIGPDGGNSLETPLIPNDPSATHLRQNWAAAGSSSYCMHALQCPRDYTGVLSLCVVTGCTTWLSSQQEMQGHSEDEL